MNTIIVKGYGKINLSLDVIRKREDGYHEVEMIMQSINLHDKIYIKENREITVECNREWIPKGPGNIAYKAAKLILEKCGINKGVHINIIKNIPVAAGLAGGSADAAAVLKGINSMFSLSLKEGELMNLGKQVGADVPFCIKSGTMLAEGIGEKLTPLSAFNGVHILLVKPKVGVSTAWVYNNLNLDKLSKDMRPDNKLLIEAIKNKEIVTLCENMKNVLETVTVEKYPVINELKTRLIENGAIGSMMSGSGPTVFGIFKDEQGIQNAYKKMKSYKWDCFMTQTFSEER